LSIIAFDAFSVPAKQLAVRLLMERIEASRNVKENGQSIVRARWKVLMDHCRRFVFSVKAVFTLISVALTVCLAAVTSPKLLYVGAILFCAAIMIGAHLVVQHLEGNEVGIRAEALTRPSEEELLIKRANDLAAQLETFALEEMQKLNEATDIGTDPATKGNRAVRVITETRHKYASQFAARVVSTREKFMEKGITAEALSIDFVNTPGNGRGILMIATGLREVAARLEEEQAMQKQGNR
jgi:hypothetical protein